MGLKTKIVRRARKVWHTPLIALAKRRYFHRILETPPLPTRDWRTPGACEVHVLTYHRDWQLALWAAKTFYHFAGVDWPLVFHIGGPDNAEMSAQLTKHFPNARQISLSESDALVEPLLNGWGRERLLAARKRSIMVRKLVDSLVLSESKNVLNLDSDILFFRRPTELIQAGEDPSLAKPVFMKDRADTYNLTRDEVRQTWGVELIDRLNAGLNVVPRALYGTLEDFDALLTDERFLRAAWLVEQTLHAVWCSQHSCTLLSPDYTISGDDAAHRSKQGPIAVHYTAAPRPRYYRTGIPLLVRSGTISDLRATRRAIPTV